MRNEFPQPFGPYELLRRLGRGGMAEVFLAKASTQGGEGRLVALKKMHDALSEDQSAVEMLIQEARLCMRFNHERIAQTFELGCHASTYYFVMEYVDGVDLGTIATLLENRNARLDPAAVAYICAAMARGLDYAHGLCDEHSKPLGIVHRDVSPQNVLIGRHGEVKLIDFGVAKVASRIQQTMAGIIKGKYAYMSPEQASAEGVDPRSDVFAVGICMHELFTGKPLFRGVGSSSPFAILRAVRDEPIALPHVLAPGLPLELSEIVQRALDRDLSKRTVSCAAIADELEAWLRKVAPRFDATALAAYTKRVIEDAPVGALPQNAIATPPIAKMRGDEFAPSNLSVVASSPLHDHAPPPRPAPPIGGRTPSMLVPRSQAPEMRAARSPDPHARLPEPMSRPSQQRPLLRTVAPPTHPPWWPSRRAVMQFLLVGVFALLAALGFSVVATLLRTGAL